MALSARLPALAVRAGVPALLTLHDYWFICGNSQLIWPDAQTCRGKALGMNCVRCAAAARFPSPLATAARPALAPLFLYRDRVVRQAAMQARRLISPSRFLMEQYVAAGFPAESGPATACDVCCARGRSGACGRRGPHGLRTGMVAVGGAHC